MMLLLAKAFRFFKHDALMGFSHYIGLMAACLHFSPDFGGDRLISLPISLFFLCNSPQHTHTFLYVFPGIVL